MIHCAIYPRKSKAVENSDSMEVQISMCKEYLDTKYGKNCYTYTIYSGDYGITGHSVKKRKDFQRMMNDVKLKKIQLVVIQRYDRIARNTRDFCNLFHDMETSGCDLVSVSQRIDTSTPYGRKFVYDLASTAELEWALCSERRKDVNRYAVAIGKCTLANKSIPVGYKAEKVDGIRRMVIDQEKKELVIDLFNHYDKYRNYTGTARYINQKYGTNMENQTVKRIIKNTVFYGKYKTNDNFCEPYFSFEEWSKFQSHRAVIRDCTKKREMLFSGLLRCPACNRRMRGMNETRKSGNIHGRYHCEYYYQGMCSNKKYKSEAMIEKDLLIKINTELSKYKIKLELKEKERNTVKPQRDKLNAELERLNNMYLKGRISEEKYDSEYSRITQLLAENEPILEESNRIEELEKQFEGNWLELYDKLDRLHKKLFWREVISEIHFTEDMQIESILFL